MPIHTLKLIDRKEVAQDTFVFYFEKPTGFSFIPGQYGGFTLINPSETDEKGITRRFSLLSTPQDTHLAIATRIQSSAYKRVLRHLALGSEVKFAGPSGNFILHNDENQPAVLIAGGIGITPFYSMICHATETTSRRDIQLFYGNQSLADSAFMSELEKLAQKNRHFTFIPTLATANETWQGERGYLSYELLKQHIPDLTRPIFYLCGSSAMVSALQEILDELGISPDHIRVEDFPGY